MVNIADSNALELMGKLEGADWVVQQRTYSLDAWTFGGMRDAFARMQAASAASADKVELWQFAPERSCVIYGRGGFNRYMVQDTGEILFSRSHSTTARSAHAQMLGFTVF